MTTMLETIAPKTDQLNFDSFIGGLTKTIKITDVDLASSDQPASLHYEGDDGKPYKPCKSMRRVIIHCWGVNAKEYIGKSMTLYGDPNVVFGGAKVGGIRISHMSHITEPVTMALTASRASRKPFTVKPLVVSDHPSADDWIADILAVPTMDGLKHKYAEAAKAFKDSKDFARIHEAKEKHKLELTTTKGE